MFNNFLYPLFPVSVMFPISDTVFYQMSVPVLQDVMVCIPHRYMADIP
jgi:hypothetical protein